MQLESRMRRGPLRLTLLFLVLPPILMAVTWTATVVFGFTDTPDVRRIRDVGLDAMTWLCIAAFISLLSALMVGPILLGAVQWRWRMIAAPLVLGVGAAAGVAAYRYALVHGFPGAPVEVLTVLDDSLAPLASLAAFVGASLIAALAARMVMPSRPRGRYA
jgi:hypothetical protein